MNGFNRFLEEKFMPAAAKVGNQRHLQAVRDGIVMTTPLVIIGSLFLILGNLPIPGYDGLVKGIFGANWQTNIQIPVNATFALLAFFVVFGVSYRLAEGYKLDALSAAAVGVAGFMLVTPFNIAFTPVNSKEVFNVAGIPLDYMGSKGMFVAIIVGILSTEIYRFIVKKDIVIKMPDGVPPAVAKSFASLIPGFASLMVMFIIRLILQVTPFQDMQHIVSTILGKPLSMLGGSLIGAILAVVIAQLLWVSGIHGQALVWGIMAPVWMSLMDENRVAFQAGHPLPHVVTQQFMDIFYSIGGSGVTLGLALLLFFRSKSKQMKQLGKLAIAPGLFNINEPITFGMPMVMNPFMMIPFVLVPVVIVTVSYIAMSTGLVAKPAGIMVPWTTPAPFAGFLATGGKISGGVLQLFNVFLSAILYYPFFRIWDKQKLKEENDASTVESSNIKIS